MKNQLQYDVPENKKIRVIVDTDAACEADDPFAIAQALMSKKLEVKALFAEQFGGPDTTKKSYDEIITILSCMEMDVPVFMGEEGNLQQVQGKPLSEAGAFLAQEAMREEEKPLFVLCLGAITNVARAMQFHPEIKGKFTVIWIGGQDVDHPNPDLREFNSGNDIKAANFVLQSGIDLWLVPFHVYSTMHISLAEIERRIYPCGKIGKHLFENMVHYNMGPHAGWTAGESWSLGDNPAVGLAISPTCGKYCMRPAPFVNPDTTCTEKEHAPLIRVYENIDSRFVLEDMMCKLELMYGGEKA